jgi:hypothetical protein
MKSRLGAPEATRLGAFFAGQSIPAPRDSVGGGRAKPSNGLRIPKGLPFPRPMLPCVRHPDELAR